MTIASLVLWVVAICTITLVGSFYAKKYNNSDLLVGLFVTFTLVAQILAAKVVEFDLGFQTFYGPAGVLIFSITFLLTDMVNEKFGRFAVHKMIAIAFVSQVSMLFFLQLGTILTPAPFWTLQETWSQIFGMVPRITIAGWIAFLVSENLDAYIFAWFKNYFEGKYLWARTVFSTLPSLLVDSLIFIPLAFFGVMPILPLIIGQTLVKWIAGIITIPFMYLNRKIIK